MYNHWFLLYKEKNNSNKYFLLNRESGYLLYYMSLCQLFHIAWWIRVTESHRNVKLFLHIALVTRLFVGQYCIEKN